MSNQACYPRVEAASTFGGWAEENRRKSSQVRPCQTVVAQLRGHFASVEVAETFFEILEALRGEKLQM